MNRHTKYRRKSDGRDRTWTHVSWRVTASWDSRPDRPAVRTTSDRKARDRMVRDWAADGAYVIVEEADGYRWRTLREVNGPELAAAVAAERAARDEAEAAARDARHRADYDRQVHVHQAAAADRAAAEHDDLAALMRRPPIARHATGQTTARHITGSQR
ncbi:hypothetical protein HXS80_20645 [Streptomyces sp. CB04723]|uniref:hypothetical protein n=1 Tax=Streptomyces TaxID=1883 RepID=UPI0015C4C128|nr:hypothetical protein [Streptomyces sp. CB04723]QLG33813.1 hypothetical protein HXS80_20645 [Streptomyces sp. CB04723]